MRTAKFLKLHSDWAAAQGEPHVTYFEPAELIEDVRNLGFSEVLEFGPEQVNARYCAKRPDGLRSRIAHFMGARIRRGNLLPRLTDFSGPR